MDLELLRVVDDTTTLAGMKPAIGEAGETVGGTVFVCNAAGKIVGTLVGESASGPESPTQGRLFLRDGLVHLAAGDGRDRARLHAGDLMGDGPGGTLELSAPKDRVKPGPDGEPPRSAVTLSAATRSLVLRAASGRAMVEASVRNGLLLFRESDARARTPAHAQILLDGAQANLWLGGNGSDGDIVLFAQPSGRTVDPRDAKQSSVHLDGGAGAIAAGGNGVNGQIALYSANQAGHNAAEATVQIDGTQANLWLGGNGRDGDVVLFAQPSGRTVDPRDARQSSVHLDGGAGAIAAGGNGVDGQIALYSADQAGHNPAEATVRIDGREGDIVLRNADFAEDFDTGGTSLEPGTVVSLASDATIVPSTTAYDTRVAGVVSGAGTYRPALVLDRRETSGGRSPVALLGKVFCKVDANNGPIEIGSILTTSSTPGRAMRATDPTRAFGAVLGKALAAHEAGEGLIPILVGLK